MTIIEWLRDKNSTENKDNILAPCMDAQTAVNFLIDYLIGDDWYVAYPACTEHEAACAYGLTVIYEDGYNMLTIR